MVNHLFRRFSRVVFATGEVKGFGGSGSANIFPSSRSRILIPSSSRTVHYASVEYLKFVSSCKKKSVTFRPVSVSICSRQITQMAALPPDVKAKLDQIPDSKIDETGKFKYILIKVYATGSDGKHVDENSKVVVRGRVDCPYHGDIWDKFREEIARMEGIDDDILGGGRIQRTGNKIHVFGYSQGYGPADHKITVEILKRQFPTHEITWSNEGY